MGASALALDFGGGEVNLVKREQTALAVCQPAKELPAKERGLRDEKWLFCKLVYEEHERTRANYPACCEVVAIKAHLFPHLVSAGKNGCSALKYDNYRNWIGKLKAPEKKAGKNKILWENKNALANCWSGGSERYGCELFWKLFFATYLNRNHWSMKQSWRMASRRTRELDRLAAIPNIDQVKYQVAKLNPLIVNNARLGPAWVRDHMLSYISRDWTAVMPNQIWFADHRVLDFPIRVWNEGKQRWEAVRPWICVYFDAKSWHAVSVQLLENSPNSWTVRNGLAQGIAYYGRPDALYIDNGRDFLCKGFGAPVTFSMNESGTETYEHSILKELDIKMTNSLPYNGRAKCVERFFGYLSREFDKLHPGYLGNAPAKRPDQAQLYYKNAHLLPNLNELCDLFDKWIAEYHQTPNNGKILNGLSPAQAFAPENRLQRAPMTEPELFRAFLKPVGKLYQVRKGPGVFFGKQEYRGTDELWKHFDKKVMIKTDANDPSHVFAFEPNGKPICECKAKPQVAAYAKSAKDRELLKAEITLQNRQAKLARTMVLQLTGGFEKLDPLTLYSLSAEQLDAPRLKLIDNKRSVKGGDHNPGIYAPADDPRLEPGYKEAIAPASAPKQLAAPETDGEQYEVSSSPEKLREFFKVAVAKKGDDYDY
ncbi:MAG: Mu transposase C-terminal domain-containing protein [Victivallaceae bacterium]|nr:Mu transposase C-terminal domain-containing protein [Victivallaceae bacterium]